MARHNTTLAMVLGFILVVAFGYFVWPTRFEVTSLQGVPVRIDRLTGCTRLFTGAGWVRDPATCGGKSGIGSPAGENQPPPTGQAAHRTVTYSPIQILALGDKVTGRASIVAGYLQIDLYNGTPCTLEHGRVSLTVAGQTRLYDFNDPTVHPFSTTTVAIPILENVQSGTKFRWQFASVTFGLPEGTKTCD